MSHYESYYSVVRIFINGYHELKQQASIVWASQILSRIH
ncbi:uncharacterized protein METZ01_LOCUS114736 [marine metagenome]|uniref:Uncharacterized protein n=1 Tax=marine metagenome TaxID=408172 RepID=A0A381XBD1_9ZZZZ